MFVFIIFNNHIRIRYSFHVPEFKNFAGWWKGAV